MKYRVNEIFLSLQGEGFWTGMPMVFLRLSGCNLACPFCDTRHESYTEMGVEEVVEAVKKSAKECRRICITGGEPLLQLEESLIGVLHSEGFIIHVETNGTLPAPEGIDWITCSPKGVMALERADELKVVFTGEDSPLPYESFPVPEGRRFLQPCDTSDHAKNAELLSRTINYITAHPWWRLSLQTHKLTGIR
ncbi:MAG: radical SAM protein [Bacteroidales bacterium]|nr:radical SAM protein [Bacteroidales bacterium]